MFERLYKLFSNDIGIDLGTANTLVYLKGKGIVISEPSVVAVNKKTGTIVAVGAEAKQMLGRTPPHIKAVRPLVDGVISDYEVTEEMLGYLINKIEKMSPKFFRPRVVIGVPSAITSVEEEVGTEIALEVGVLRKAQPHLFQLAIAIEQDAAGRALVEGIIRQSAKGDLRKADPPYAHQQERKPH
jgi:rod shape-determining protein MreB